MRSIKIINFVCEKFYLLTTMSAPLSLDSIQVLNDGINIPCFGLGTYDMSVGYETANAVNIALKVGYRLIDTAAAYK